MTDSFVALKGSWNLRLSRVAARLDDFLKLIDDEANGSIFWLRCRTGFRARFGLRVHAQAGAARSVGDAETQSGLKPGEEAADLGSKPFGRPGQLIISFDASSESLRQSEVYS